MSGTGGDWPSAARLVGVGLGPGDPDYVTLRAVKVLRAADRLVHFAKMGERGYARTIADAVIGRDPERELPLYLSGNDRDPARPSRLRGGDRRVPRQSSEHGLSDELGTGRSVAVLCEGDPFFYGSFTHLWLRLKDRVAIEIVPGVTGMAGAAARAGMPIGWADDVLTVLPATLRYAESGGAPRSDGCSSDHQAGAEFAQGPRRTSRRQAARPSNLCRTCVDAGSAGLPARRT